MRKSGEVITLADGIDTVAAKFARRYEPYQNRLEAAWSDWQTTARALGVPREYKGQNYWLPSKEISVEATDDRDHVVHTMARVSVRGTLKHVRHAQRAMRIMQRCQAQQIALLPAAANTLWSTLEEETAAYAVRIAPVTPGLHHDTEYIQRPLSPTRMEWMRAIDTDGPDILRFYELRADEDLETLRDLTGLLTPHGYYPGPDRGDGPRATGGTEAGIAL